MKKLMLSAFVAVLALVACNKQDTTPVGENYKSIEISLDNVIFNAPDTKEPHHDTDNPVGTLTKNNKINLKTVQVFFTDGDRVYTPKNPDGTTPAQTYWGSFDSALQGSTLHYHYLPPAVDEVIVIGNFGAEIQVDDTFSVSDLQTIKVETENQQDPNNLLLYDRKPLTLKAGATHTEGTHTSNNIYEASMVLLPKIARFEIINLGCNFSSPALYDKIQVHQIHFADRYDEIGLVADGLGTLDDLHTIDLTSQATIFSHLTTHSAQAWYNDMFTTEPLELTPSGDPETVNLSYNFIPSADETNWGAGKLPRFVLRLTAGTEAAYVYTTSYDVEGVKYTSANNAFKPGHIYRITDFAFADTDLEQQQRCVELKVQVLNWEIHKTTANFGE